VEGAHDKGRDCPGLFCIVEIISKGLCTPLNKWWLSWDFFTWVASRAKRHTCELGTICSWDYSRTNGANKLTLWVNKVELQEHIVKSFQWCPGDKWFSKWVGKWWGVSTFEGTPTCDAFLHTFNMKTCTHKTHLEMELLCSCSLTSKVVQCNAMKFTKNLMRYVHLEDTKTLWENRNSPWWNVKGHYVDVHSMSRLMVEPLLFHSS